MFINFNLRSTKGTKPQPVYAIVRFGEKGKLKKVTINTKLKINPKLWSSVKQKPKPTLGTAKEVKDFESNLQKVSDRVKKILTSDNMSVQDFRNAYNDPGYSSDHTLYTVIDLLSRTRSPQYKNLKVVLNKYEDEKKTKLNFEDITLDFYNLFLIWSKEEGYSDSSVKTYIGYLKIVMRYGLKAGQHNNDQYLEFRSPKPVIQRYFISEDELHKLQAINFDGEMEIARDLFIVGAWTGLRAVDLLRLHLYKPEGNRLTFHMKKGKKDLQILLLPPVMKIYNKWNFSFPYFERHWVYFYKVMKKVFEESNLFNGKVEVRIGKDSFKMIERWKLFKPHIARRSFATNSASRGVPIRAIMNQGGWSSISQVQKYIQHDNESDIKSLESSFRDLNMAINEG